MFEVQVLVSRVGDRCSRQYDCTAPFSACLNSQCVCITGTVQQGLRCVASKSCPFGGTANSSLRTVTSTFRTLHFIIIFLGMPGQVCIRKASQNMVENFIEDSDNCPKGQVWTVSFLSASFFVQKGSSKLNVRK